MTNQYQNQNLQYSAPQQANPNKVADPFWFRQNHAYLFGVTNMPSNPTLGINNIRLSPASQAQMAYGMLYNGLLTTAVGTLSFQIRLSKSQAPFVQTTSDKVGTNPDGTDRYWESIVLNAPTKAQILRHMEAIRAGQFQMQQPVQQPVHQPIQQPMAQQHVQYQQVQQPQYAMAGAGVGNQAPMVDYTAQVPPYTAPQNQSLDNQAHTGAGNIPPAVGDDDLPF